MLGLVDALWFLLKILSEIFWQIGSGTWIWTWSETWREYFISLLRINRKIRGFTWSDPCLGIRHGPGLLWEIGCETLKDNSDVETILQ